MRRFTVMGFTEAELGFVIAAALGALAVTSAADRERATAKVADTHRLAAQNDSLRAALDAARRSFAAYRDSATRHDSTKRSTKTPRCTEKGEPPGAVADLFLLGSDRYGLGRERLTFAALETRLDSVIQRSRGLHCRYLVRTHAVRGVDGPETAAAARRLWTLFDVDEQDR